MRFRCNRPTCGTLPRGHVFEADVPQCPKCGAVGEPSIHQLTDVHFLAPGGGPIRGAAGPMRIACEPTRAYLSAHAADNYSASHLAPAVTCLKCRGTEVFEENVKTLFPQLWLQMQMEKQESRTTVDLGARADGG